MVIQRWQSLLLLLAAAIMACFAFCPIAQINTSDFTLSLQSYGFRFVGEATGGAPSGWYSQTWYFFTLSLLCVIMPLIAIFMYRNLRLQKRLTLFSILFVIADFCVGWLLARYTIEDITTIDWNYTLFCGPVLAVCSLWLAWRYINRDQKLLASVDRLR